MEYDEFRAMNCAVLLAAEGERAGLERGFREAREFIRAAEARFTRFSTSSELARLNAAAGRPFQASPQMFDVLAQARRFAGRTGGLFNPAILDALENAGYDRSMDTLRATGLAGRARGPVRRAPDFLQVHLDAEVRGVLLPPGMRVDLGGIAKGWIAEKAAEVLAPYSTACAVSAGGDMMLRGTPAGQAAWEVALEDPRDAEGRALAVLHVGPGALTTSAVNKRRWLQDGREQHHLIDPRSGLPARSAWLSVTVLASHAATAEVYSKALLIAGPDEAEALAQRQPDVVYLAVDRDGRLWAPERAMEVFGVELQPA